MKTSSRLFGALCLAVAVGACGPTSTSPSQSVSAAPPSVMPFSFNLSGQIFEDVDGVRQPIEGAVLGIWGVPCSSPGNACTTWYTRATGTSVASDASGRYAAPNVAAYSVIVVAYKAGYMQACGAVGDPSVGNTDIEMVSTARLSANSAQLLATTGPRVVGTVFETTPQGPKGIPGAYVYAEPFPDIVGASTLTDANGHFTLCNVAVAGGTVSIFADGYVERDDISAVDGMSVELTHK